MGGSALATARVASSATLLVAHATGPGKARLLNDRVPEELRLGPFFDAGDAGRSHPASAGNGP